MSSGNADNSTPCDTSGKAVKVRADLPGETRLGPHSAAKDGTAGGTGNLSGKKRPFARLSELRPIPLALLSPLPGKQQRVGKLCELATGQRHSGSVGTDALPQCTAPARNSDHDSATAVPVKRHEGSGPKNGVPPRKPEWGVPSGQSQSTPEAVQPVSPGADK